MEPIIQEERDAYVDEILEYRSGNQAAALSGSHLKNSDVVRQFGQQGIVDWQRVVGEPELDRAWLGIERRQRL